MQLHSKFNELRSENIKISLYVKQSKKLYFFKKGTSHEFSYFTKGKATEGFSFCKTCKVIIIIINFREKKRSQT